MKARKLFIHIGHQKTGSSSLQNFFAEYSDLLSEYSTLYPSLNKHVKAAQNRKITSGNGGRLLKYLGNLASAPKHDLLFSSENLFYDLLDKEKRREVLSHADRLGLEVEYICYTRDFFSLSFSHWGQNIKRGRGTLNYVDFILADKDNRFTRTAHALQTHVVASSEEKTKLSIFNYDRHKENLRLHFLKFGIGLDIDIDKLPKENPPINRSMSISEYELQRLFNVHYLSESHRFISDPLVEKLPHVKSEIPFFTSDDYDRILNKHQPIIDDVNKSLSATEKILIQPYDTLSPRFSTQQRDSFNFTSDQLAVVVESIASELNNLPQSNRSVPVKKSTSSRIKEKAKRLLRKIG